MQLKLSRYLPTVIGALILMVYAFYDRYPIVTFDSGTYIGSGFTLDVPRDRPIFYGLFIRATSLGFSLWLTIFCQSLLLSWLLIKLIKRCVVNIPSRHLLFLLAVASIATTGGWHASQLMPDVFTPILGIALVNLLYGREPGLRLVYLAIAFAATIMHNSHLLILAMCWGGVLIMWLITKRADHKRNALSLVVVGLLSFVTMSGANYIGRHGFTPSGSSHVFLMGKLVENGILKKYLDEACAQQTYAICAYKDNLPPVAWEFVWDASSPLNKTGGWEANKKEYRAIIREIVSRPKYVALLCFESIKATGRQVTLLSLDGTYQLPWMKFLEDTPPYVNVATYFPQELSAFKTSKQNAEMFNVPVINNLVLVAFILSTLFAIAVFGRDRSLLHLYCLVLAFVVFNAFITASFANVLGRLNTRAIWLIPFMNIVCIYRFLATKFSAAGVPGNK